MRRTKAEAEQTRNDILKAALILFDEQGYAQTTLSTIARKAKVTRGAIYWHFENKEEILAALAQAQFAELNSQINTAIAAPDTWQNLADNFIAYFRGLLKIPTACASAAFSTNTAEFRRWKNCIANTRHYGKSSAAKRCSAAKKTASCTVTPTPNTSTSI
jgi:transcriptional regulator ttgR